MISVLLLILPLVFALLTLVGPKQSAGRFSTILSLISLALSIYGYSVFRCSGGSDFMVDYEWIRDPSIHIKFSVDGIGLLMIVLTNLCIPFVHLSADKRNIPMPRIY